jgi:hypothetical protein
MSQDKNMKAKVLFPPKNNQAPQQKVWNIGDRVNMMFGLSGSLERGTIKGYLDYETEDHKFRGYEVHFPLNEEGEFFEMSWIAGDWFEAAGKAD